MHHGLTRRSTFIPTFPTSFFLGRRQKQEQRPFHGAEVGRTVWLARLGVRGGGERSVDVQDGRVVCR